MKKYSLFLYTFASILLITCHQSSNDQQDNGFDIAILLQRHEKLQCNNEWTSIQNRYANLTKTLRTHPIDPNATLQLAHLFIQEARVTGEHGHYYQAALRILDDLLNLNSDELTTDQHFMTLSTKAGVHLSLHNFQEALTLGQEAMKLNKYNAQIYGVLVDANIELGRYKRAVELADQMVAIRPDLRSYARISYLREIHGDISGAMEAMEMAVAAGFPIYEETAWARLTLGELYERYDMKEEALMTYESILQDRPNYPFALAALAHLAKTEGRYKEAQTLLDEACGIIPEVGFYITKAEICLETGREKQAQKITDEVLNMLADDVSNGHNMDLEYAHIYVQLKEDPQSALKYLERTYAHRPDNIYINRAMASIYLQLDEPEKARKHFEAASRTQSADPELVAMAEQLNQIGLERI